MTSQNAWKYIAVAYAIVAVPLLIAWIVGLRAWGDVFSLGQLLVDAVFLPVAVIGFFMATEEFRKTQATPDLDLHWQPEPGITVKEFVARMPAFGSKTNWKPLVLSNKGNAVSTWYLVKIQIPGELFGDLDQPTWGITGPMQRVPHDQVGNWRVDILKEGKEVRCEFMSGGQVAAFPDDLRFLADLHFALKADQNYPPTCQVKYTIVADQMRRRDGILTIQILPEEAEKAQVG